MTSKKNLKRRLADLEGDSEDGDEGERVTIRSARVDEDGEPIEVFSRLEIWEDEHGEQRSERTVYEEGEGPDPIPGDDDQEGSGDR